MVAQWVECLLVQKLCLPSPAPLKWVWWPAPVIPALRSGEAGGPKVILLLITSSRPAWVIETVRPYQKKKIIGGKERKRKQVLPQGVKDCSVGRVTDQEGT